MKFSKLLTMIGLLMITILGQAQERTYQCKQGDTIVNQRVPCKGTREYQQWLIKKQQKKLRQQRIKDQMNKDNAERYLLERQQKRNALVRARINKQQAEKKAIEQYNYHIRKAQEYRDDEQEAKAMGLPSEEWMWRNKAIEHEKKASQLRQ